MLHIKCPHCGMRSQNEFSYGGDASVKRPELGKEVSDGEWNNFIYNRICSRKINARQTNFCKCYTWVW